MKSNPIFDQLVEEFMKEEKAIRIPIVLPPPPRMYLEKAPGPVAKVGEDHPTQIIPIPILKTKGRGLKLEPWSIHPAWMRDFETAMA